MRRTLLVALAALAIVGSACGRLDDGNGSGPGSSSGPTGSGTGGITHPAVPDEPILQVTTGGGFIAPSAHLTEIPSFSLYGDGTLITPGAQIDIYPQPLLPAIVSTSINEDGIQAILDAARSAGLLEKDATYGFNCVADAPTTTFTVHADGAVHTVSVYALGMDESGCKDADAEARAKLAAFQGELGDLRSWLPEGSVSQDGEYEPTAIRVYVQPYGAIREPGLDEPAIDWPISTGLDTFGQPVSEVPDMRCGVVAGSDLEALLPDLRRANALTPWQSAGAAYGLLVRPLLPDERTC